MFMLNRLPALVNGILVFALTGVAASRSMAAGEEFSAEQLEFFEREVRPLLADHCYSCHSAESESLKAGLRVDSRQALLAGGDSGPAIAPQEPNASLLIEAVRYESFEMPPKGKLDDEQIATLTRWVELGAPWPEESEPAVASSPQAFDLQQRSEHWVWQPIAKPAIPGVNDTAWPIESLDHFILARLEQEGLAPAPPVDRRGLLRRLYFDLIGLPPTPEQVAAFLADDSQEAVANVVDALLASPEFGERWGRHWMDLVRYAESRGHENDYDVPNAFQYRDYIVRALNADVPYDQLVREHLAGDLLEHPRVNPERGFNESILGTGFWFFGEWVHSPVDIRKDESDRFDNMIDVMSKTFLGVTVACARCHDHKFDAITSRDYYALSGFLQSSDYSQVRFESLEHNRKIATRLAELDAHFDQELRTAIAAGLREGLDETTLATDISVVADTFEVGRPPTAEVAPLPDQAYRVLVDYGHLDGAPFLQNGLIFGDGPRGAGEILLGEAGSVPEIAVATRTAAVNDPFWHGLVNKSDQPTHGDGSLDLNLRSGRTLHTPSFDLQSGEVLCQVQGRGQIFACVDSHRMLAGPLHNQTLVTIPDPSPDAVAEPVRWVAMDLRRYAGHRIHLEFTPAAGQTLAVLQVVERAPEQSQTATPATPATTLGEVLDRWERGDFGSCADAPRVAESLNRILAELGRFLKPDSAHRTAIETLTGQWRAERASLRQEVIWESQLAIAMMEGSGEDDHLLIRGSTSNPGEIVPRRFLEVLDGPQPLVTGSGSGRLALAERINDPGNPLASRVIVNRLWHHLLGRGIVPTTDDFGFLGMRPSHPELLDFLAADFLANGRSIKQTIRTIVLSRTYQMSGHSDPAALSRDPTNSLWHHLPPRRLEGETIRDALLAISGELRPIVGGPSVPVHLTNFMDGRGRPGTSGPLDGDGRRSIYTAIRRNFISPMMLAFDTPVPFSTMGRRNVSNVPAQALILMNDPFVVDRARTWAQRSIAAVPGDAATRPGDATKRIQWMFETAFARPPSPEEHTLLENYVADQCSARQATIDDLSVWTDVAHALINSKEFIYLR